MQKAKLYSKPTYQNKNIIQHEETKSIRLNKYISECGVASRRESDKLIELGEIKVNGEIAVLGTKIFPDDIVTYKNKIIKPIKKKVYLALNKPEGIVSTTNTNFPNSIIKFLDYDEKVFTIGRLDKNSTGLILLTNDGDVVNKILRVEYGHDKEYVVTLDKPYDNHFVKTMERGVEIYNPVRHENQITLPTKIRPINELSFSLIIKQGLNRQIRRMCDALGYKVKELKRIRIMHIKLESLPVGYYRYLTESELNTLNEKINE